CRIIMSIDFYNITNRFLAHAPDQIWKHLSRERIDQRIYEAVFSRKLFDFMSLGVSVSRKFQVVRGSFSRALPEMTTGLEEIRTQVRKDISRKHNVYLNDQLLFVSGKKIEEDLDGFDVLSTVTDEDSENLYQMIRNKLIEVISPGEDREKLDRVDRYALYLFASCSQISQADSQNIIYPQIFSSGMDRTGLLMDHYDPEDMEINTYLQIKDEQNISTVEEFRAPIKAQIMIDGDPQIMRHVGEILVLTRHCVPQGTMYGEFAMPVQEQIHQYIQRNQN
ncbi:MAG: hypothetical protein JW769_00425, partial [Parachlamydiales bacterium]|nr:hypothetical protein [Parachlamydiales bacterium]